MAESISGAFTPAEGGEVQSPSLGAANGAGPAFESKFLLTHTEATTIEEWAREYLTPDSHGENGCYAITSVYCDTPAFDVFHRSPGYRRSKYRIRRYGMASAIYLEQKKRRGDQVKKKRAEVANADVALLSGTAAPPEWPGAWFLQRLVERRLHPVCRVAYQRTAFFGLSAGPPIRLTLDRDLSGGAARGWDVFLTEGRPLLPEGVLLEMKFHTHLPELFRELLPRLPIQQARLSKYRRCMELCGLTAGDFKPAAPASE